MKLAVISSSPFIKKGHQYSAYAPYLNELEIWARHFDEIAIACPIWEDEKKLLVATASFKVERTFSVKEFNIKSIKSIVNAIRYSFVNFYSIYKAMIWADHIHLRCPGNVGLMACIVQLFFPNKPKTAKYAGNWDPNAVQPISYRLQKWILSNTLLTKNMQVLVYGEWKNQSNNIKPFFTATYSEAEKTIISPKDFSEGINFLFVGTLAIGKRPLYAVQLIEELSKKHKNVSLNIFGTGEMMTDLKKYINENKLNEFVFLRGNLSKEKLKNEYITSHFVLLPSKSEGWPKVVAEGMFWNCLPIATSVSCISSMLDNENRGLLLALDLKKDVAKIEELVQHKEVYSKKVQLAMEWSRKYTVDFFEEEIKKLTQKKQL
jgi:glycosyltransferase involved in cell wall biosynthesis